MLFQNTQTFGSIRCRQGVGESSGAQTSSDPLLRQRPWSEPLLAGLLQSRALQAPSRRPASLPFHHFYCFSLHHLHGLTSLLKRRGHKRGKAANEEGNNMESIRKINSWPSMCCSFSPVTSSGLPRVQAEVRHDPRCFCHRCCPACRCAAQTAMSRHLLLIRASAAFICFGCSSFNLKIFLQSNLTLHSASSVLLHPAQRQKHSEELGVWCGGLRHRTGDAGSLSLCPRCAGVGLTQPTAAGGLTPTQVDVLLQDGGFTSPGSKTQKPP